MPDVRREVGRGKGYRFHPGVRGLHNPPLPLLLPALCECTFARKCQDEGGGGGGDGEKARVLLYQRAVFITTAKQIGKLMKQLPLTDERHVLLRKY